jgi:hypothetical protein
VLGLSVASEHDLATCCRQMDIGHVDGGELFRGRIRTMITVVSFNRLQSTSSMAVTRRCRRVGRLKWLARWLPTVIVTQDHVGRHAGTAP